MQPGATCIYSITVEILQLGSTTLPPKGMQNLPSEAQQSTCRTQPCIQIALARPPTQHTARQQQSNPDCSSSNTCLNEQLQLHTLRSYCTGTTPPAAQQ
jgi:hypothetical protein